MIHARCTSCSGLYSIEDHRGYTAATYCPACGAYPMEAVSTHALGSILAADERAVNRRYPGRRARIQEPL